MINFFQINTFKNPNNKNTWKYLLKIGLTFILIGYLIFILKEIIVGFISILFIGCGIYFVYLAYNLWKLE